jgi:hypothetical protein
MLGKINSFIPKVITTNQAKDTGMAMVLICLLIGAIWDRSQFFIIAIPVLVINMIFPDFYRPVAKIWLGLSTILGTIMSKLLLSLMFFIIVTPIGLARKLLGADSLNLKIWNKGNSSVFKIRDHTFTADEIEKPY